MKKRIEYLVFSILFIAITANTFAQDKKYESLKKELQSYIDSITSVDLSIKNIALLVETPHFKWKGASGMSVPEENIKMLPDDQFVSASSVKMMMSTMVLLLMEQGKLELDDKISLYIPDSILNGLHVIDGKSYGEQITIYQLLNHTSGLADFWHRKDIEMLMQDPYKFWSPQEKIEYFKKTYNAKFEPGKGWSYSDIGYDLLAFIIEKVTGKKLYEAYSELLFKPLRMEHTYSQFYEEPRPAGNILSNAYMGDLCYSNLKILSADWGGGGMVTNTEDMNTFLRAFENNKIFKNPETKELVFDLVKVDESVSYGLGIFYIKLNMQGEEYKDFTDVYGHSGASGTFMFYSKTDSISVTGTINQADEQKSINTLFTTFLKVKNFHK